MDISKITFYGNEKDPCYFVFRERGSYDFGLFRDWLIIGKMVVPLGWYP